MNGIFSAMLVGGTLYALLTGRADAAQHALLSGGGEAIALCVSLAGTYAFFGGMMGVLRESGAAERMGRLLSGPIGGLLGLSEREKGALPDICLNLSFNMLGMGGAATPAGIAAMRRLEEANPRKGTASRAEILFLVVNVTGVQLLPWTMIALRAQAGAKNPSDIALPTLFATTASTLAGVLFCRCVQRWGRDG